MLVCTPQCALRFTKQTTGGYIIHLNHRGLVGAVSKNPTPNSPSWAISKPATMQHFPHYPWLLILAILVFILTFQRYCDLTSQVFPIAVMEFSAHHRWTLLENGAREFFLIRFTARFNLQSRTIRSQHFRILNSNVAFLLAQCGCYECICLV